MNDGAGPGYVSKKTIGFSSAKYDQVLVILSMMRVICEDIEKMRGFIRLLEA